MAIKKMIRSSIPLGSSFPGGPYEKGKEKAVDATIINNPIIKGLIQSGDIVVIDASMRKVQETASLETQLLELQKQLKEAQDKLAILQESPVVEEEKPVKKAKTKKEESAKPVESPKLKLGNIGKL